MSKREDDERFKETFLKCRATVPPDFDLDVFDTENEDSATGHLSSSSDHPDGIAEADTGSTPSEKT
ncbi:hypothetical protein SAMN04488093_1053 [Tropicibacter naphthalenivorans]|uniref:Uncharacterized protein n=1 Tax=Tropicibacter naphthalenivorans TaxID=441103 RepID=A0A0P1GEZ7_9RHOB|nr:hypothetical protein TRN7648_02735 [Tropicibacter naphthalenivorans]SMC83419.1 hypothetical protein SAMN04488093_1053 [Tropicibacter naphthalenivorans]